MDYEQIYGNGLIIWQRGNDGEWRPVGWPEYEGRELRTVARRVRNFRQFGREIMTAFRYW